MNEEQDEFALKLGQGNFPEGVRLALDFTRRHMLGEDGVTPKPQQSSVIAPTALIDAVTEIGGDNSFVKSLRTLIAAARVLTPEVIRKLGRG